MHVFGYPPTQHADLNLLSTGDDASIGAGAGIRILLYQMPFTVRTKFPLGSGVFRKQLATNLEKAVNFQRLTRIWFDGPKQVAN